MNQDGLCIAIWYALQLNTQSIVYSGTSQSADRLSPLFDFQAAISDKHGASFKVGSMEQIYSLPLPFLKNYLQQKVTNY